jgi:hypothetical protein
MLSLNRALNSVVVFPYILLPHSSSESNHWLSFSWSLNGIQLAFFISFNSSCICLKTCTMRRNLCSSSKINFAFFEWHLQSRRLNCCFWWPINVPLSVPVQSGPRLLPGCAVWTQGNYHGEQIGFSHISFANRPLDMWYAVWASLVETASGPHFTTISFIHCRS